MGKSAKHASRSGTKRKTRLKGGQLIDPVTQGTIVNLRCDVVFMSLFLRFVFLWFCLSFHRGTVRNPIRGYAESWRDLGFSQEGNEGNEGSCRDLLGSLEKVTKKPGIPARLAGFFTEKNEGKEGAGQIETSFPFTRNSLQKETKEMKACLVPAKYNLCSLRSLLFTLLSPMHPLYEKADKLSSEVIGAAIEVHRHKGPGLIESIYERCMLRELELHSIPATTQKLIRVEYKGLVLDEPLRFDLLVDDCLLVELKAVEILHPSSKAQLFSYMKLLDIPIRLLINFHEPILKNGISRMILPGANQAEEDERNQISL
jgi:GxxExxY protein